MTETEKESKYFFRTYERIPIEIDRGEGVYLFSKEGKRYLDMFAGYAVNALGYGNPKILRAVQEQCSRYIHLSNSYLQDPQIDLAELLLKHSGYEKVFFSNSGTESVEGALKIAKRWGSARGKNIIISFSDAFHGRTTGALSLMDRPRYREGYEPLLQNCRILKLNDTDDLQKNINEQTLAVFLEFIQGESGVRPVTVEFARAIGGLKKKFGFLVVADEIQSGLGRTGKLFAFQHYDLRPDVVVLAKALGGGLPLGAILGNSLVAESLETGRHGSTFGGNPVACAAGKVVLKEIMENGVMQNAAQVGDQLKSGLMCLKNDFPSVVRAVRGSGLMLGLELNVECRPIVKSLREKGVLLNCTYLNVLRFLPPLIISEEHIVDALKQLRSVLLVTAYEIETRV